MKLVIETENLGYSYRTRKALNQVNLQIPEQEFFAILGPNGGGKSTLFKILSTIIALQQGKAWVNGFCVTREEAQIRKSLGVVFQSPSLDDKLTVKENLIHQGHLYQMSRSKLRNSIEKFLTLLNVMDRQNELVKNLSGGLKRRVELARALLHQPKTLLLDEPTTGLDPSARREFWLLLQQIQKQHGTSIVFTTHLFDEAERSHRLAILDNGDLIAQDTPGNLKGEIGGNIISIETPQPQLLLEKLPTEYNGKATILQNTLRLETKSGQFQKIFEDFSCFIHSLTISKPSLEDVYIRKTGKSFAKNDNSSISHQEGN